MRVRLDQARQGERAPAFLYHYALGVDVELHAGDSTVLDEDVDSLSPPGPDIADQQACSHSMVSPGTGTDGRRPSATA